MRLMYDSLCKFSQKVPENCAKFVINCSTLIYLVLPFMNLNFPAIHSKYLKFNQQKVLLSENQKCRHLQSIAFGLIDETLHLSY